jgi:PPP family 3-phenylpropionic acid transporter
VAVAIEIAFFALQGRVMPRLPATAWLALCGAVAVGRFVLTAAFGGVLVVLVLAQALHAITFAAHHSACIELLNRHFGGALRGRGQALYTAIGYGASGVIGGLAGGWLVEQAGFASVFWAAAVAAALGTGCAWRAGRATNHRN